MLSSYRAANQERRSIYHPGCSAIPPVYNNCLVSNDKTKILYKCLASLSHVAFAGQKPYRAPPSLIRIGHIGPSVWSKSNLSSPQRRSFCILSGHFSQLNCRPSFFNEAWSAKCSSIRAAIFFSRTRQRWLETTA